MAGYIRQSTADIIPTATVRAAPINAEYNALRDAFSATGGHKHDGTTGEGEYIPLIADLDALNKVVIDTTNNRIGFFVEVSSAAVEQVRIQDGVILPVTNNDIDLGSNGAKFKNLYIQGTADIGTVDINAGNIDGTIIGSSTPAAATFTSATLNNNLSVTGTSTLVGTTTVTSIDLNSGAIDNTTIGTTTPVAGTFTTLAANTSLTAATADINGGTLDNAAIGSSTPSTAAFTTLSASGTATLATVDINAGNIDNTTIGASNPVAGSFTTVSTSGNATLATANISGGSINGTTVGASSPTTGAFTTLSASGGVTGDLTGNVTGNITGDVTGDLTGNVAGNLTGNVTSTGTSTFNNVTIDGTLNMNAGTTATITNLTDPTNNQDAATKAYVDTSVANLIDSAPDSLNTLNELAAALNDDDDAFNTLNTAIGTKLPKAGGTMTGAIAMGTNVITGLGDPSAAQDAATKNYVDTQDALQVTKSGDTMSGNLAMGNNKITGLGTPTATTDATNKTYVDGILGSATAAASSASAAATSASNAATSETNAASSASAAAADRATVASLYDSFDDRYLGPKSSAPTQDNDGNALVIGALYFNSTNNIMYVYGSGGWQAAGSSVNGTSDRQTYTATSGQTVFASTYDAGYVDVYLNGVKLLAGTDFTATNGTSVTLASGAAVNDIVDIVAYGTFVLADHLTETQSDAKYVQQTHTGNVNITGTITSDGLTVDHNTGGPYNVDKSLSSYSSTNGVYLNGNASGWLRLNNDGTGSTKIDLYGSSYSEANVIKMYSASNERLSIDANGDISFYDTSGNAKFFWDASAESLGIGTSSLSSYSSAANNLVVQDTAGEGGITIVSTNTGSSNIFFADTDAAAQGQIKYQHSGDYMRFYTNGAEAMRIDSSGRVGIGRTPTSNLLEVADTIKLTNLGTSEGFIGFNTNGQKLSMTATDAVGAGMKFEVGTSEAMRIDSSGNLLVGTASSNVANQTGTTQGVRIAGAQNIQVASTAVSAYFNKLGTDGDIVEFRKSAAPVGSIGSATKSGDTNIFVGNGDVGVYFHDAANSIDPINPANGFDRNGDIDLGRNGVAFKDLHLSGGVYLGGTGSANKLDDYEEGAWTPTYRTGSALLTSTVQYERAEYRKIGETVWIHLGYKFSALSGTNTGAYRIYGLPFASKVTNAYQEYRFSVAVGNNVNASKSGDVFAFVSSGGSYLEFRVMDGGDTVFRSNEMDADSFMSVWGFYVVA